MIKKGGSKHLKRLPAPANWPIHRKEFKFVAKPRAGPHSLIRSMPLLLVIREVLGLAKNRREAKLMLSEGHVKIDGVVRRDDDYPIGIMDIVEIPAKGSVFRVLPSNKGLRLHTVKGDEREFKLCKIVNKTTVSGGHLQLNLHDGRNVLEVADAKGRLEDVYSVHDVLKIAIPSQKILAHLKFEEGILGMVDSGKNAGVRVEVTKILRRKWPSRASVALKNLKGNMFETIVDYVFPIGKGEPWITLPEENSS